VFSDTLEIFMKTIHPKTLLSSLATLSLLASCINPVNSAILFYSDVAQISGVQTIGSGRLEASTVVGSDTVSVNVVFTNLTSKMISATIASPNRICSTTNTTLLKYSLDGDGKSGRVYGYCQGNYTQQDLDDFNNKKFTIIIATVNNPNGEIRGIINKY
jgi:hypothetical protein